jgi:hypothetical protein
MNLQLNTKTRFKANSIMREDKTRHSNAPAESLLRGEVREGTGGRADIVKPTSLALSLPFLEKEREIKRHTDQTAQDFTYSFYFTWANLFCVVCSFFQSTFHPPSLCGTFQSWVFILDINIKSKTKHFVILRECVCVPKK